MWFWVCGLGWVWVGGFGGFDTELCDFCLGIMVVVGGASGMWFAGGLI